MCNNILEIRSDAWLLCRAHQRPIWRTQEDIGSWHSVIFFVSLINTMVNAGLTAFVGSQLDDTGGTFLTRIRRADLWMVAVLIEHAVLGCKFLVKVILPEEPEWVATSKAALEYRQELIDSAESLMPTSVRRQRRAAELAEMNYTSKADEMHELLKAYKRADADDSGERRPLPGLPHSAAFLTGRVPLFTRRADDGGVFRPALAEQVQRAPHGGGDGGAVPESGHQRRWDHRHGGAGGVG